MSTTQIDWLMQQGVECFLRRDFAAALDRFTRVVQVDAMHAQALNNRGAALLQLQRYDEALPCFERLLVTEPDNVEALSNSGFALLQSGRAAPALAPLERALQLAPRHVGALNNRGLALLRLRRAQEALDCFEQALVLQPHFLEALNNRGLALTELGRHGEALACFDHALALAPQYLDALNNRGLVLRKLHRPAEALPCFEQVLAPQPAHFDALNNRGLALVDLDRHEEALACFDRALALQPRREGSLVNRGLALEAMQRHDEALECFDAALRLRPDEPSVLINRAATLLSMDREEQALGSLEQVLRTEPDHADALQGMGVVLERLNRRAEALPFVERSLKLRPGDAETRCSRGFLHLALGRLPEGFRDMEARWDKPPLRNGRLKTAAPLWTGQPLGGKTLLLHHEQGFGDTLQISRYLPLLTEQQGTVILRVPPALLGLMRSLRGGARLISDREPLPPHDWHCPLMSLPLACGATLETIPAAVPYLAPEPARVEHWRQTLGARTRPRIGLVWAGRQFKPVNRRRDMPLDALRPLLQLDARFISLQKDIPEGERELIAQLPELERHGETVVDFADTAALIENLDLVITVDSAVSHLAGALARPVWIMNRYAPCWRWLEGRGDSPWYPTARLFKQQAIGDWDGLVREVMGAAREFVERRGSGS